MVLSSGTKWLGCEADHSHHLMLRSRMCGAILPLFNMLTWCNAKLSTKHNFTVVVVVIAAAVIINEHTRQYRYNYLVLKKRNGNFFSYEWHH
jgi:hypothetical protein